jgi:hypothetical protein
MHGEKEEYMSRSKRPRQQRGDINSTACERLDTMITK